MNDHAERIAIIGVGSPHGDDQFGWTVVDDMNVRFGFEVQKVKHPIDFIASLDEFDRVIVVDAAVGLPDQDWFQSLCFANAIDRSIIRQIPHHGTHDVGLYFVLRLAESLGKRVDHVQCWLGNASGFESFSPMSPGLTTAAKRCAAEIAKECFDARTVAG